MPYLVSFRFVIFEKPGTNLQLITRIAELRLSVFVVHLVSLRQRKVARAGFGAWLFLEENPGVRVFVPIHGIVLGPIHGLALGLLLGLLLDFVLDAISVAEQDLSKKIIRK